jgi:hypothetical protein
MLEDHVRRLRAQIVLYREQIALTTEPGLKATFATFLELVERELAVHVANAERGEAAGD